MTLGTHDGTRANLSGLEPSFDLKRYDFAGLLSKTAWPFWAVGALVSACCRVLLFERRKIGAALNLRCIFVAVSAIHTLTDVRFPLPEGDVEHLLQVGLTPWM